MNEPRQEIATFGAGCFWCTEAVLEQRNGVYSVKVGYMGGREKNPTYRQVSAGNSGHAEVAQIVFDPNRISYRGLLEFFWHMHDPTTLNRQGADVGTHYRSVIFFHSAEQEEIAKESLRARQKKLHKPIVTQLTAASDFYEAEDYHQDYFRNNPGVPYCRAVIIPKLRKVN